MVVVREAVEGSAKAAQERGIAAVGVSTREQKGSPALVDVAHALEGSGPWA